MQSLNKQLFNQYATAGSKNRFGEYKRNIIQQALKEVNFNFHRTSSSSILVEDLSSLTAAEKIIHSTIYGSEESTNKLQIFELRRHTPLLMANKPNSHNERELRRTDQQTDHSRVLPEIQSPDADDGPAQHTSPVAAPGRPLSILGSVCALLLAKQASSPKLASSSICRICFGGSSGARLVRPCACRGTVAAVHRACLERWLLAAATSHCELCRHHYVVTRRHKWSLWRSLWEWGVSGRGRALAADVARGALLGAASVLGTARMLRAADALLHAAAAKGSAAALAANVFSSVLIGIIGALNGLLTTWMLLKVQEHQASWRAWRDSTVLVRVALDPTPPPTPPNDLTSDEATPPPTTTSSVISFDTASSPAELSECATNVVEPIVGLLNDPPV
ncbi:uncharacterized protein LOC121733106 isoform X2 [Aricia agestis]|uniref:uncharacterized protein LOC121733106 isoform X2 n=1 Tax=Aricia agestis TaxID=91739 RepID=UPI001C20297A|nr:uncharacterized protein LOC121733106 isoform X2 [Aricia agestis]